MNASQDQARKIYEGQAEREAGRVNAGPPASWTRNRVSAGRRPRERALNRY
jgi:hypothetical protein